ncbi:MAG: phosphoenolpyruvate--protein phosphotransferase [Gammaproteobacteria bacterium]|nr:phosphoenolpyruvate--protein phosphotransferase [Gammaproteobacteria bacterium]
MSLLFNGIGVSRGFAIGKVHLLQRDQLDISQQQLEQQHVNAEIERFLAAVDLALQQLRSVRDNIPHNTPIEISEFIDTHLLMLDDPMLKEAPTRIIIEQQCNAEWALKLQRDAVVEVFERMDDPYLRTRKDDIDHVVQRIQRILLKKEPLEEPENISFLHGSIVIADDLTPADMIVMQHQGIVGFITESGGPLSHTAILARSLGIPAIVGVHQARHYIKDGEEVILNGYSGLILATPDDKAITHFRSQQQAQEQQRLQLNGLKDADTITLDGTPVILHANIESAHDIDALHAVKAHGVGLYRTEFLYLNRNDIPSEEEHYQNYLNMVTALQGAPLTIRTVDLGADKEIQSDNKRPLAHNPALGLRGIRRCLNEPALFMPQLRAILRASAKGPVKILLPMISNLSEIHQSLELLEVSKQSLQYSGLPFDPQIEVGAMIEVPAAAISAHYFAQAVDFLSIGTNDLIQYTLAMDRIDDEVNYLYDPLHPAVLTLINHVIEAGKSAKIPVSMCGEMAGDPRYVRLLLSLGLRTFSMPPNSVLEVKQVINNSHLDNLKESAQAILHCSEPLQQATLLQQLNLGIEPQSVYSQAAR